MLSIFSFSWILRKVKGFFYIPKFKDGKRKSYWSILHCQHCLARFLDGLGFSPSVSDMYSLEDIKLVPNMATRACGGTVDYPVGFKKKFQGGLDFYHVSLTCFVQKILS